MGPSLFSLSALAAELQLDRRTLARRLGGLAPAEVEGRVRRYLLADVLQHLSGQEDATAALARERARLARLQADRVEVEGLVRNGTLVLAADVERAHFRLARDLRDRILALPSRIAAEVAAVAADGPRAVETKLDAELRAVLQGLAEKETLGDPKGGR